ncbi:hypothetical protein I4U23_030011 [Adineta vaga]|nr:hypothetical protein I4U23_030011 [Adineta vaga]
MYEKKFCILYLFTSFHLTLPVCIPSSTQCGCSRVRPTLSESKIVGGYTARNNSWPWIVSLRRLKDNSSLYSAGSAFCGGTLINDKYILTAAHCFDSIKTTQLSSYMAVVGAIYKNDTNSSRFRIRNVMLHENYNSDTYENDIALFELYHPVDLNDYKIGFICLPSNGRVTYPYNGMNATAIGWGRLQEGGSSSYTLQQVQLPIIEYANQYCSNLVYDDSIQFCAGFIQGGKDTCQGDSGGPLMTYDGNSDTWIIAGITSYGHGCAQPESPGIYTR